MLCTVPKIFPAEKRAGKLENGVMYRVFLCAELLAEAFVTVVGFCCEGSFLEGYYVSNMK
jgi:hypothetical protein